jgi:hypothetical protein
MCYYIYTYIYIWVYDLLICVHSHTHTHTHKYLLLNNLGLWQRKKKTPRQDKMNVYSYLYLKIALVYGLDGQCFESRQGLGISLFTTAFRLTLWPTHLLIQWLPGSLSLGLKRPGGTLTNHLHLVPRSRIHGAIPLLLQYAFMAWCSVKTQWRYL